MFVLIVPSSCGKQTPKNASKKDVEEQNAESLCHFKKFEVTIPGGWIGSGNTTKFYYNDAYPAAYLIVGENVDPEEDIAKNLELFEGTMFYRNKIKFIYETYENEKVTGTLVNERLERNMYFSGYYLEEPDAYIFGVCESYEDKNYIMELTDYVYSSIDYSKK